MDYSTTSIDLQQTNFNQQQEPANPQQQMPSLQPREHTVKKENRKTKSSHIRFAPHVREMLKKQADNYGVSLSVYLTVLITRNAEGADKPGFEKEIRNAKKYIF